MSRICFYVGLLVVALSFIKAEARSQNCNVLKSQLDALERSCSNLRNSYFDFLEDCRATTCDGKLCNQLQSECEYLDDQVALCAEDSQDKHIDCSAVKERRDQVCKDSNLECQVSKDCYYNFCILSEDACERSNDWSECQTEYRSLKDQYNYCLDSNPAPTSIQTRSFKFLK